MTYPEMLFCFEMIVDGQKGNFDSKWYVLSM